MDILSAKTMADLPANIFIFSSIVVKLMCFSGLLSCSAFDNLIIRCSKETKYSLFSFALLIVVWHSCGWICINSHLNWKLSPSVVRHLQQPLAFFTSRVFVSVDTLLFLTAYSVIVWVALSLVFIRCKVQQKMYLNKYPVLKHVAPTLGTQEHMILTSFKQSWVNL